jgi:hypothetical protein
MINYFYYEDKLPCLHFHNSFCTIHTYLEDLIDIYGRFIERCFRVVGLHLQQNQPLNAVPTKPHFI